MTAFCVPPPLKLLWLIPYKVIISEGVGELGVTVLNEEAVRGGGTVATFPLLPGAYPRPTHQWLLATLPHLRYLSSGSVQFSPAFGLISIDRISSSEEKFCRKIQFQDC